MKKDQENATLEAVDEVEESIKPKKDPLSVRAKNYFNPEGIHLEMLRYRPNKTSYMLGLLAAVFLAVGFCSFYSGTELNKIAGFNLFGSSMPGPWLGVDIVINILMLLFMLFSAMRMKDYSVQMGGVSIGLGVFQIIRIFLLPLSLTTIGCMSGVIFTLLTVFYTISGVCSIFAGILAIKLGHSLIAYLKTVKPIENEKVGK